MVFSSQVANYWKENKSYMHFGVTSTFLEFSVLNHVNIPIDYIIS